MNAAQASKLGETLKLNAKPHMDGRAYAKLVGQIAKLLTDSTKAYFAFTNAAQATIYIDREG